MSAIRDLLIGLASPPTGAPEEGKTRLVKVWKALELAEALIQENNALRRNNERLTKENAELRQRNRDAESSARTAQTMATAYRIEARGGDYDATKEDGP